MLLGPSQSVEAAFLGDVGVEHTSTGEATLGEQFEGGGNKSCSWVFWCSILAQIPIAFPFFPLSASENGVELSGGRDTKTLAYPCQSSLFSFCQSCVNLAGLTLMHPVPRNFKAPLSGCV